MKYCIKLNKLGIRDPMITDNQYMQFKYCYACKHYYKCLKRGDAFIKKCKKGTKTYDRNIR